MRLDGRRSATGTGAPASGAQKIFEVRKLYNDITFIDEFFTLEFCIEQKFYTFGFNERSGNWEIMSREFKKVKDQLLQHADQLRPAVDRRRGRATTRTAASCCCATSTRAPTSTAHRRATRLRTPRKVWTRPVSLLTKVEGKGKLLRCEDGNISERSAEYA